MIFARKMPGFYVMIAQKTFFSRIVGGNMPLPDNSYAYAYAPLIKQTTKTPKWGLF